MKIVLSSNFQITGAPEPLVRKVARSMETAEEFSKLRMRLYPLSAHVQNRPLSRIYLLLQRIFGIRT